MTGRELWVEVTDGEAVTKLLAATQAAGMTTEEAVKAAVTGWATVFQMPADMTVESICTAILEFIDQCCPFRKGVHILSRFGMEWELQGQPDDAGFVKAKRLCDGTERAIRLQDIKNIVPPAKAGR
jgi:hypothetical protein